MDNYITHDPYCRQTCDEEYDDVKQGGCATGYVYTQGPDTWTRTDISNPYEQDWCHTICTCENPDGCPPINFDEENSRTLDWPEEHVWAACKEVIDPQFLEYNTEEKNLDCKHHCNSAENEMELYSQGFCAEGYDFYEEKLGEDWGPMEACRTYCLPEGTDFDLDAWVASIGGNSQAGTDKAASSNLVYSVAALVMAAAVFQ